jgi:hypothetical protein
MRVVFVLFCQDAAFTRYSPEAPYYGNGMPPESVLRGKPP